MKFSSWCFILFLYLSAMLLIAWFDVAIGIQISLWIFYGIPIGLATWNFGRIFGCLIAVISLAIILLIALIWGSIYGGTSYLVIALASKFAAYLALVCLVGELRKKNMDRVFIPKNKF